MWDSLRRKALNEPLLGKGRKTPVRDPPRCLLLFRRGCETALPGSGPVQLWDMVSFLLISPLGTSPLPETWDTSLLTSRGLYFFQNSAEQSSLLPCAGVCAGFLAGLLKLRLSLQMNKRKQKPPIFWWSNSLGLIIIFNFFFLMSPLEYQYVSVHWSLQWYSMRSHMAN